MKSSLEMFLIAREFFKYFGIYTKYVHSIYKGSVYVGTMVLKVKD